MINENYGLIATIKKSDEDDENGEKLILMMFKPKDEIDNEMKFEEESYLSIGKTENVVISHVVNFDTEKTIYKEHDKKTYVIIFNTHIYVKQDDVTRCFEVFANAMKNIDNWIKIPKHDASKVKLPV